MKRSSIILFLIFLTITLRGQLILRSGTILKLNNGTTLNFLQPDSLTIEPSSHFQNNGTIKLNDGFKLIEYNGFPIYGSGKETILFSSDTSGLNSPGNMGFSFETSSLMDSLTLDRFHDTLPGFQFQTVRRYFHLRNQLGLAIPVNKVEFYADTSEFDSNNDSLWHLINSDLSTYQNVGSDTSGTLFCLLNDTITNYTYFTLSSYKIDEFANTIHDLCKGDTLILQLNLQGAFEENSLWFAELSQASGFFSPVSLTDSSRLTSNQLFFKLNTGSLMAGSNYRIRISDSLKTDTFLIETFQIDNVPPSPVLNVIFDTIFTQNYSAGTIQWYLDDQLISGNNDSLLLVSSNGIYTVEFISPLGCISSSDIIYNSLSNWNVPGNVSVNVFPNPFHEQLNILANQSENIQLFNITGQLIYSKKIEKGENNIDISQLSLANGIYYLHAGGKHFKLLKE